MPQRWYTTDNDEIPTLVECDPVGYPHRDALGRVQFTNTHYDDEREAWQAGQASVDAAVQLGEREVELAEHKVREARRRLDADRQRKADFEQARTARSEQEQEKPSLRVRRGRGSATAAATEKSAKPAHEDTPTVISASEAADLLGIHRTTLYEIAKRGEVPCRRIGRRFIFVRETLIEWMRGNATPHGPTMPGTE
jgi:excisionase family DNA binding protein